MFSLDTHGYIVCFSCSKVLSISKKFAPMLHARFPTPNCVFHEDFACEFIYHLLCGFLAEQGTLSQFSRCGPGAQIGLLCVSIINFLRRLMHRRSTPHFWVEVVSTSTYPVNSQPSLLCKVTFLSSVCLSFSWLLSASFVLLRLLRSSPPPNAPNWLLSLWNVSS